MKAGGAVPCHLAPCRTHGHLSWLLKERLVLDIPVVAALFWVVVVVGELAMCKAGFGCIGDTATALTGQA